MSFKILLNTEHSKIYLFRVEEGMLNQSEQQPPARQVKEEGEAKPVGTTTTR